VEAARGDDAPSGPRGGQRTDPVPLAKKVRWTQSGPGEAAEGVRERERPVEPLWGRNVPWRSRSWARWRRKTSKPRAAALGVEHARKECGWSERPAGRRRGPWRGTQGDAPLFGSYEGASTTAPPSASAAASPGLPLAGASRPATPLPASAQSLRPFGARTEPLAAAPSRESSASTPTSVTLLPQSGPQLPHPARQPAST
jgi:hypothetical protein